MDEVVPINPAWVGRRVRGRSLFAEWTPIQVRIPLYRQLDDDRGNDAADSNTMHQIQFRFMPPNTVLINRPLVRSAGALPRTIVQYLAIDPRRNSTDSRGRDPLVDS